MGKTCLIGSSYFLLIYLSHKEPFRGNQDGLKQKNQPPQKSQVWALKLQVFGRQFSDIRYEEGKKNLIQGDSILLCPPKSRCYSNKLHPAPSTGFHQESLLLRLSSMHYHISAFSGQTRKILDGLSAPCSTPLRQPLSALPHHPQPRTYTHVCTRLSRFFKLCIELPEKTLKP